MFRCMKNRGYPVCMASTTRTSPSSYPTLSAHLGNETEMACSVKAGIGLPRGFCKVAIAWSTQYCFSGAVDPELYRPLSTV